MESRLKERLTGAAILVALIVLLVPEIFRGQRGSDNPQTAGASGSEGAPVRSYTIDLSNNAKVGGPLRSTGDNTTTAAEDAATRQSAAKENAAPNDSAGRDNGPPSPPQSAPPAPAPAAAAAAPSRAPAPAHAAAPSAPRASVSAAHSGHPAAAGPIPTPAPKAAAAGGWSVQLGLFAKRENAERLVSEAQRKGFAASLSSADGKGQFHVRASGLADRASAESLAQRLKSAGFSAAIIAPRS